MLQTKFGWEKPVVSEEMLFENVNRRLLAGQPDRQTQDDRQRAITKAHPEHMLS